MAGESQTDDCCGGEEGGGGGLTVLSELENYLNSLIRSGLQNAEAKLKSETEEKNKEIESLQEKFQTEKLKLEKECNRLREEIKLEKTESFGLKRKIAKLESEKAKLKSEMNDYKRSNKVLEKRNFYLENLETHENLFTPEINNAGKRKVSECFEECEEISETMAETAKKECLTTRKTPITRIVVGGQRPKKGKADSSGGSKSQLHPEPGEKNRKVENCLETKSDVLKKKLNVLEQEQTNKKASANKGWRGNHDSPIFLPD